MLTGCNNDYKCMWYNVTGDIWQNNGCDTFIDRNENKIKCSCSHLTTFATIYNIHKECDSAFVEQLFTWKYWDYINWTFAILFLLLSVYILLEIYPFFVDKYLTFKQMSVYVMLSLFIISLLYFMVCIMFHFLKYYGLNSIIINILVFLSLVTLNVYFIVFSLIFYTWFSLTHSININEIDTMKTKTRHRLYTANILTILFTITVYILTIIIDRIDLDLFFITTEIIWSAILSIICIIFIIYAYFVAKVVFKNMVKTSTHQSFAQSDLHTAKKLLFINFCITLFFITQCILSIYYTVSHEQFALLPRIIDLTVNLLFIILLCWMYRNPMRNLIKFEGEKEYNHYYCCQKWFVLTRIGRGQRFGSKSELEL